MLKKFGLCFLLGFLLPNCYANSEGSFPHPFYLGVTGGYGSTTWDGLVPPRNRQGAAILLSTPIKVNEGGGVWGLVAGYEVIPVFAVEAAYTRYPNATIFFDPTSLMFFDHNITELVSHTDTLSLMGKFMLVIPHTTVRAYSSAGIARVHRWDQLRDSNHVCPTFGVGFDYDFTDHFMGEVGFNYTSGYAQSQLDPAEDFVPFLYSVFARLAYRFG